MSPGDGAAGAPLLDGRTALDELEQRAVELRGHVHRAEAAARPGALVRTQIAVCGGVGKARGGWLRCCLLSPVLPNAPRLPPRTAELLDRARVAPGGEIIYAPPCTFPERLSTVNTQGRERRMASARGGSRHVGLHAMLFNRGLVDYRWPDPPPGAAGTLAPPTHNHMHSVNDAPY